MSGELGEKTMQVDWRKERTALEGWWIVKNGVIAGVIGAITFAVFAMLVAWLAEGKPLGPFHEFASIMLTQPPPQVDLGSALVVGTLTHLLYSLTWALVIALAVALVPELRGTVATMIFTSVVGFVVFPLTWYVLTPLVGAPWYAHTEVLKLVLGGFVNYTFFFGLPIGFHLASQLPDLVAIVQAVSQPAAT